MLSKFNNNNVFEEEHSNLKECQNRMIKSSKNLSKKEAFIVRKKRQEAEEDSEEHPQVKGDANLASAKTR